MVAPEICGSSVTRLVSEIFDVGTGSLENLSTRALQF